MTPGREVWYGALCYTVVDVNIATSSTDDPMAVRHIRDILGEAGSLYAYALCSVVGKWIQPDHHPEGEGRPVLLVPGFMGRGLAFFRLKRALARRGYPVYVADLGYGVGCIEEKAELLEEFIASHQLSDFYVVGHSMGGIISMAMSEKSRRKVRHFVTLGTAFHGAVLSYLVPIFPAARQLNPESPVLERVVERARQHDNLTNVVAQWDEIALPMESCRVEGCHEVTGVAGHVQLIMRSSSFEHLSCLLEELEQEKCSGDSTGAEAAE